MTEPEIAEERRYRIAERVAILCGAVKPTREQENMARREADEWEDRYRTKMWNDRHEKQNQP